MKKISRTDDTPAATLRRLRRYLQDGGSLLVEDLAEEELVAMHRLLMAGEAEIISQACRPYLSAKLERTIISH